MYDRHNYHTGKSQQGSCKTLNTILFVHCLFTLIWLYLIYSYSQTVSLVHFNFVTHLHYFNLVITSTQSYSISISTFNLHHFNSFITIKQSYNIPISTFNLHHFNPVITSTQYYSISISTFNLHNFNPAITSTQSYSIPIAIFNLLKAGTPTIPYSMV